MFLSWDSVSSANPRGHKKTRKTIATAVANNVPLIQNFTVMFQQPFHQLLTIYASKRTPRAVPPYRFLSFIQGT